MMDETHPCIVQNSQNLAQYQSISPVHSLGISTKIQMTHHDLNKYSTFGARGKKV